MNRTSSYNLCQWEETDRVRRTDFNEDNVKIDQALGALRDGKAEASALEGLALTVAGKGNCLIETGSYTGDGSSSRTITITASFKPKLVVVVGPRVIFMFQGAETSPYSMNGVLRNFELTWSGNSVSWPVKESNPEFYQNDKRTYYYAVFG